MTERVKVVENILAANQQLAQQNRATLDAAGVFAINIMASPGAGKTSLIERTIPTIAHSMRVGVVDGDIASNLDAERAARAGAQAIQINTGGECHLDAVMLQQALNQLDLSTIDLLIVENVGNLICPAGFALGTHKSVLVASVPEGDDKPIKYPGIFRSVDILVLNKIDLLPYVPFDMKRFIHAVRAINPGLTTFPLSCQTGEGISAWVDWLTAQTARGS